MWGAAVARWRQWWCRGGGLLTTGASLNQGPADKHPEENCFPGRSMDARILQILHIWFCLVDYHQTPPPPSPPCLKTEDSWRLNAAWVTNNTCWKWIVNPKKPKKKNKSGWMLIFRKRGAPLFRLILLFMTGLLSSLNTISFLLHAKAMFWCWAMEGLGLQGLDFVNQLWGHSSISSSI